MAVTSDTHLAALEAESIFIMREVAAEFRNPVMLYSIGKDSSVMLRLAEKAFHPGRLPFPLLHVDTRWKFRDMYAMRDAVAAKHEMRVFVNPEAVALDINPFDHGGHRHTDLYKTQGLRLALREGRYDAAFGGARRDEEKSRAKERVFSLRDKHQQWDPRSQRPELWNLYNCRIQEGESMRVFPLSNWTEADIWLYIYREKIPVVPLYLARERPVVERDGTLIMVDDARMRLLPGETARQRLVRFRSIGCYPLSGAVESSAETLEQVVSEVLASRRSERQGRLVDRDADDGLEQKKREGYF